MHARSALALLSLIACTPATPPVERVAEVVEATPALPAKAEPELPIGDAAPDPRPIEASQPIEPTAPVADTPAPAVPGKPVVAAKRHPDNVYGVLAEQDTWTVDIIDFDYVEGSAAALALGSGDEPAIDQIPAGSPAMPVGWAVGDDWTLITRAGTVPKQAESFAAYVSMGSGALHFKVRLGSVPRGGDGPAVAIRGRTTKSSPTLSKPVPVAMTVLGDDALTKITTAITPKLDADQRKRLREHPLEAKHVEVFAGRFPGERTHAIIVRMEGSEDDATISGVLFAKPDGTIELVTISEVWGEIEPFAIGDLDGDGTDELVYEDSYHEGWYLQLLHWKHGKPKIRTLTGDGV